MCCKNDNLLHCPDARMAGGGRSSLHQIYTATCGVAAACLIDRFVLTCARRAGECIQHRLCASQKNLAELTCCCSAAICAFHFADQSRCTPAQGQQVFITYGQQSNDKLLQYYGFVEPKAPADDFKVHDFLAAVEADLQPSEGRRAALQSAGFLKHLDSVSAPGAC